MNPNAAIAVFDSGVGGLTVLAHLAVHFPKENFIYLGDSARLPYGDKTPQTIRRYVEQNTRYLKTKSIKAVVVACNSASTVVLNENHLEDLPLFNVIDPGARKAAASTQNGIIGVIGTQATVRRKAYADKLLQINPKLRVEQMACPLLVPFAEQGLFDDPITALIVHRYVQPLKEKGIDTLILGCTHYPLLKKPLLRVVGSGVSLIDSGQTLTEDLHKAFSTGVLKERTESSPRRIQILMTDLSENIADLVQLILEGHAFEGPTAVDIGPA